MLIPYVQLQANRGSNSIYKHTIVYKQHVSCSIVFVLLKYDPPTCVVFLITNLVIKGINIVKADLGSDTVVWL